MQQRLHPGLGPAHRAIDPFIGKQNRSEHMMHPTELLQFSAQPLESLQWGKAVEGRHQLRRSTRHQPTAGASRLLATPAAASNA